MQTVKIIVGIVCLAFAFNFFLGAAATLADHMGIFAIMYTVPAIFLAVVGWRLIRKRNRPLSKVGKTVIALVMASLLGIVVVIVIPDFVRMRYSSSQNACINTLRELQAAKQEWALEKEKTNGAMVTIEDITPYVQLDANGHIPKCPAGGTYILGRVGEDVRCSIGASDWPNMHSLSDTNVFTWKENFRGAYRILFGLRHVQKP
jgi:hypothetical protein